MERGLPGRMVRGLPGRIKHLLVSYRKDGHWPPFRPDKSPDALCKHKKDRHALTLPRGKIKKCRSFFVSAPILFDALDEFANDQRDSTLIFLAGIFDDLIAFC